MDFNPNPSIKFNLNEEEKKEPILEPHQDSNGSTFTKSFTYIIKNKNSEDAINPHQEKQCLSLDSEKNLQDDYNSFTINQEDSSPMQNVNNFNSFNQYSLSETETMQNLLKKRLSSIAETRESESYHDNLKSAKDRLIVEKIVMENSKENISERNSFFENEGNIPPKLPKSPLKTLFLKMADSQKLNKSPIITSDTQLEIYKSLNLDQSTSGMNILKELENRKNNHNRGDRSMALSFNLEKKNNFFLENKKKYTADDNKSTQKTHKTFQNLNYSSNAPLILKEDPLKKIDQEYEEEELIDNKSIGDTLMLSSFNNSEKNQNQCPIRIKNVEIFRELCETSKANFSCIYSNEEYIAGGTDKGLITVIEHKKTNPGAFIILGLNSELKNQGQISGLDIGYHNKLLLARYSSGIAAIFNLKKGKMIKKIEELFKKDRIKMAKFLKTDESKKKGFIVIAANEEGKIARILFQKTANFGRKKIKKHISEIIYKPNGLLLQIEPFFFQTEKKNIQKNSHFLACTTTSRLFLQSLEDNSFEFEIEKSQFIDHKAMPLISFDQTGYSEENQIRSRFIVSWGNLLLMICCKPINSQENSWKIQKYLIIDKEILFSTIISCKIILGIDCDKRIFLIHFDEMIIEEDFQKMDFINKIDLNNHVLKSSNYEMNQLLINFQKNSFDFSNNSFISCDFSHSNLYFLINSELLCLNLISWDKILQNLIEEEDYLQAMANVLQIYKKKIKYWGNIPADMAIRKQVFSNPIKEITIGYFIFSIKKIEDILTDYCYVKEIATTIEFLVETEQFDFLFNNIMKDLELKGFLKQFICSLEPFILKKKIRVVPEIPLLKLLDYFIKENKQRLADKLIFTLDLKQIVDYNLLISTCLENHLFKGLIHLCSDGDDNFMIPLIKILSIYLQKSSIFKLSYEKIEDLKFRCLWYIQICIKGHLITREIMPLEKWKKAIRQVGDWIMDKENFFHFLKLDPDIAFRLLFMLFKGYPYQIIKKSPDYFNFKAVLKDSNETIYYDYSNKIKKNKAFNEIMKIKRNTDKILNDPLNFMIEFIIINEKNYAFENPFYAENKRYAFFAFIIQLYHQAGDYTICPKIGYACVNYFMENPDKLDLDLIYEADVVRYLMKDELEIKRSECLLEILRLLQIDQESSEYIDKLLTLHSTLSGVTLYLLMKKRNFLAGFDLFIKTKNPIFKNKVFDWLHNVIMKLEIEEEYLVKCLKDSILIRTAELVSVNSHKAHKIFKKYHPNEEQNIIISLQKYPKLGIEYVHQIHKAHSKDLDFHLDDELAKIYVEFLIKEKKLKKLNQEIKSKLINVEIAKKILNEQNLLEKLPILYDHLLEQF